MFENNEEDLFLSDSVSPTPDSLIRSVFPVDQGGTDEEDKLQILSVGSQPLASSNEIKAELPCEHQNQSSLMRNLDAWPRSHLVLKQLHHCLQPDL